MSRPLLRTDALFFFSGDTGIINCGRLCLLPLLPLFRPAMPLPLPPTLVLSFDSDSIECELDRLSEATSGASSFTEMRIADVPE